MGKEANPNQRTLHLTVEVSGCLGECAHCWAQGHPYPPMELTDIERVLEEGARFCRSQGLRFMPFPMHEVLMHPDALRIIRLFYSHADGKLFEPFTTPGPLLAQRADWEEILGCLKELGTTTLWFAIHGLDELHDRVAGRNGAFKETATAIERAKAMGLRCGTNLFITSANAHQIPEILEFFRCVGMDEFSAEVVSYNCHARGREHQALRPNLAELLPYAQSISEATMWHRDFWSSLDKHTEGYYVNHMLANPEPGETTWPDPDPIHIPIVCRSNFDLRVGKAGSRGPLYGNLRKDDPQAVLRKAVEAAPYSYLAWCIPGEEVPSPLELVQGWGNPEGQKVYMRAWDLHMRLSDLALGKVAE